MQRKHVSFFTVLLAVVVLATGALAQDRGTTARDTRERETTTTNPSSTNPTTMSGTNLTGSQLVRAEELIGSEVVDPQGDTVGEIDDMLLDAQGDAVTHVVVSRGGFLGIGVKRHAVPWRQVQLDAMAHGGAGATGTDLDFGDHEVRIDTDKDQFALSNPPLDAVVWDEYEPDDMGRASRRVSDILGSDVNGRDHDAIGEVQDLVIDAGHGRIAYALVDYDGAWDLDADQLSVPWPSVNRSVGAISTTLDESSARQLGYRTDDFDRLGEPEYRDRLYGATGSVGYWDDDGHLAGGSGSRDRYASATSDSVSRATSGTMAGERVTVSGTIESIMPAGTTSSTPGSAATLMFSLKQGAGTTVTVDAGSKAALDRQNCNLKQGDRVTVTGHRMTTGKDRGSTGATGVAGEVIMARTIEKDGKTVQVERSEMHDKSTSPHDGRH